MSITETISCIVSRNAVPGRNNIVPDTNLLDSGVLDSLGIMAVVADLDKELGCRLQPADILPENFRNLTAIVQIAEKTMGRAI